MMKDYPISVVLMRGVSKRVVGFTTRIGPNDVGFGSSNFVYLDFFNNDKKLLFLMKYSEYLR